MSWLIVGGAAIGAGVGSYGHDNWGWEYWRRMKIACGTVRLDDKDYPHPKPQATWWRPDRLICEYKVGDATIREQKFISTNDDIHYYQRQQPSQVAHQVPPRRPTAPPPRSRRCLVVRGRRTVGPDSDRDPHQITLKGRTVTVPGFRGGDNAPPSKGRGQKSMEGAASSAPNTGRGLGWGGAANHIDNLTRTGCCR